MVWARELYESTIKNLPIMERLRLASLILDDIAPAHRELAPRRDMTDEEASDLAKFLMEHAGIHIPVDQKSESKSPKP